MDAEQMLAALYDHGRLVNAPYAESGELAWIVTRYATAAPILTITHQDAHGTVTERRWTLTPIEER